MTDGSIFHTPMTAHISRPPDVNSVPRCSGDLTPQSELGRQPKDALICRDPHLGDGLLVTHSAQGRSATESVARGVW
jgi:hypothetical protein